MNYTALRNLNEQKEKLQKLAATLKGLFDDKEIRRWGLFNVEKNQHILQALLGGRPLALDDSGDSLGLLASAQTHFRLHPTKREKEDIFITLTKVQDLSNKVSDALIAERTAILPEITAKIEQYSEVAEKFITSGKVLKTALRYIETFSMHDLLLLAAEHTKDLKKSEQILFQQGEEVLVRINEQMSGPDQEGLKSLVSTLRKAEEVERLLEKKRLVLEDLQESTNTLAMLVLKEDVFEQVSFALGQVKNCAASLRSHIDSLNKPILAMEAKLREGFHHLSLQEYCKEIDSQRQKLSEIVIRLVNSKEIVFATDTMSEILLHASVFLAHVDEVLVSVQQKFSDPQSSLNPLNIATLLMKKYYFESLWLMVKRFFGRPLAAETIVEGIMKCPDLLRLDAAGDGGGRAFLKEHLAAYETSWVYGDVQDLMEEGIAKFTYQFRELIWSHPIHSFLTTKKYLGDLIDSIAIKADTLKKR